ncbi:MAG: peptide-methionine (R)-S-oxide reductase MsrB [Alphaproteobacteria bacterium]|nr:peptide-methionine (R)-S-oxide reductase MsrB [Alphaproteobacteria bacterium]
MHRKKADDEEKREEKPVTARHIARRSFLATGLLALAAAPFLLKSRPSLSAQTSIPPGRTTAAAADAAKDWGTIKEIRMSDEEWKKKLDPKAYDVLRCEGTESPFTSPLNNEHRKGVFKCAGCGLPLFTSSMKFDSGTGWPSFYEVIDGHVQTKQDNKLYMARTEYHCAQCGGHQGHVFNDGPAPTGLRYCNNGVALRFEPETDKEEK